MSVSRPLLSIRSVCKRFGKLEVLRNFSLDVMPGEFLTILGESGSGKTTLLRLIAGFEALDGGEILMSGDGVEKPITLGKLPPYRRPVNTVFQSYALFPHLSVFENVAYPLRIKKRPKPEIQKQVTEALNQVKMGSFAQSQPSRLSGGQQQRVALARALVNRPKLLLLDEPLSALDANLRRQMQSELKALQKEVGITFILITHDQEEAMALSDRIALLRSGQLEQIGTPQDIYFRPKTAYVARFVGQTNILDAQAWKPGLTVNLDTNPAGTKFSLRPEKIELAPTNSTASQPDHFQFRAKIGTQRFEGATQLVELIPEITSNPDPIWARLKVNRPLNPVENFVFSVSDAVVLEGTSRAEGS